MSFRNNTQVDVQSAALLLLSFSCFAMGKLELAREQAASADQLLTASLKEMGKQEHGFFHDISALSFVLTACSST